MAPIHQSMLSFSPQQSNNPLYSQFANDYGNGQSYDRNKVTQDVQKIEGLFGNDQLGKTAKADLDAAIKQGNFGTIDNLVKMAQQIDGSDISMFEKQVTWNIPDGKQIVPPKS